VGFVVAAGFLHAWRMPAFFLLAGLLAASLLERKGPRAFIVDRTRRLLIPFVALWPVVWAVDGGVTRWGRDSGFSTFADPSLRPVHLWFLLALAGFSLMMVAVRAFRVPAWLAGGALPLLLAVVQTTIGEARPADSFLPDAASVLSHGSCFFVGTQLRSWAGRGAEVMVMVGMVVTLVVYNSTSQWQPMWAAAGAAAGGVAALGLLGLSLRLTQEVAGLSWLLDRAYWLYLVHYPVVQVMHVLVAALSVGGVVKYALVCLVSLVLPLSSWRLVQLTPLGTLLQRR
jgi:glucans biosynthesis protein C